MMARRELVCAEQKWRPNIISIIWRPSIFMIGVCWTMVTFGFFSPRALHFFSKFHALSATNATGNLERSVIATITQHHQNQTLQSILIRHPKYKAHNHAWKIRPTTIGLGRTQHPCLAHLRKMDGTPTRTKLTVCLY